MLANMIKFNDYLPTASMAERLTRVPRVREVENSFLKGRPNLTQRCKRFATASTSTQVAIMKGLVWFWLFAYVILGFGQKHIFAKP